MADMIDKENPSDSDQEKADINPESDVTTAESKADSFYAFYTYSVARSGSEEDNDSTSDASGAASNENINFTLTVIASDLNAERETELRKLIARRISRGSVYGGTGTITTLEVETGNGEEETKSSEKLCCYYSLLHQEVNNDETLVYDYVICFMTTHEDSLQLFRHELDKYSASLSPILDKNFTKLEEIQTHLKSWYNQCIAYISRCVKTLRQEIKFLIHTALINGHLEIKGGDEETRSDIRRFFESCNLMELLSKPDDKSSLTTSDSDSMLINVTIDLNEKLVPTKKIDVVTLTLDESGAKFSCQDCTPFCQDWAGSLCNGNQENPFYLRQIVENYKLRTIQDMNTLKRYLRKAEGDHYALFSGEDTVYTCRLTLLREQIESVLVEGLRFVNQRYRYQVLVRLLSDDDDKIEIQLESNDKTKLDEAHRFMLARFPYYSIFSSGPPSAAGTPNNSVYKLAHQADASSFHSKVREAIDVIERTLSRYDPSEICVGFNGGKDCTVVVHLFHAVMKHRFPDSDDAPIKSMYIRGEDPFSDVEVFIRDAETRYNLTRIDLTGRIKTALCAMKNEHAEIKAVVMGTRRTDPYSETLGHFAMTDADWPQYMRVNPIINWTYTDLWTFIRHLEIPYCRLYDRGYTSLGNVRNTHPNPLLKYVDDNGEIAFHPAYHLEDCILERRGRISS
ncbi:uncharacterized protein LOC141904083 isoform X2 [Tubulanus polymorphus]|uniref:uncharacterized protein LOC141904083 isoform X2 n=1 Tax=Tubulanus polymorphus TaxID=672921 RepID=UPI003DA2E38F